MKAPSFFPGNPRDFVVENPRISPGSDGFRRYAPSRDFVGSPWMQNDQIQKIFKSKSEKAALPQCTERVVLSTARPSNKAETLSRIEGQFFVENVVLFAARTLFVDHGVGRRGHDFGLFIGIARFVPA